MAAASIKGYPGSGYFLSKIFNIKNVIKKLKMRG